jgi:ElaB/YqjD/DUF883 family membrane-anchored ribosome-binding protein
MSASADHYIRAMMWRTVAIALAIILLLVLVFR